MAAEYGVSPWVILEILREDYEKAVQTAQFETPEEPDHDVHTLGESPIEEYKTYLTEASRPPSRGGNTRALHRHVLVVGGQKYSWLAVGAKKWAYAKDRVSFQFTISPEGYRNVLVPTFRAVDQRGEERVRGDRSFKPQLRTAGSR